MKNVLSYKDLFIVFLKAGMTFGGGLGILAILEKELVTEKKVISQKEFLSIYGIGRIVPAGTMAVMAIAYGYKFKGWLGTLVALFAMNFPGLILTIILAATYVSFRNSQFFSYASFSILPAALGFIVLSAFKMGKSVFKPTIEILFPISAFAGVFFFKLNPSILLILGGIVGIVVFSRLKEDEK